MSDQDHIRSMGKPGWILNASVGAADREGQLAGDRAVGLGDRRRASGVVARRVLERIDLVVLREGGARAGRHRAQPVVAAIVALVDRDLAAAVAEWLAARAR